MTKNKLITIILIIISMISISLFIIYKNQTNNTSQIADASSNDSPITLTTITTEENGETVTKTAIKVVGKAKGGVRSLEVEQKDDETGKWNTIFSKKDYAKNLDIVEEMIQTDVRFGGGV